MSNRQTIIDLLTKNPDSTMDDLAEMTGWSNQRVKDTISDLRKNDMITSKRDDITNRAIYRAAVGGSSKSFIAWKAKPVVAKNTGSQASGIRVAGGTIAEHPPEGLAVVEAAKQEQTPAEPASDDNFLRELLKEKDTELFNQAQTLVALRREVQSLTDALNLAKRRQTSGVGDKYMVLCQSDVLFDTPEQAAANVFSAIDEEDIEDAQVIAVNPIGRVKVKTVFVPHVEAA